MTPKTSFMIWGTLMLGPLLIGIPLMVFGVTTKSFGIFAFGFGVAMIAFPGAALGDALTRQAILREIDEALAALSATRDASH